MASKPNITNRSDIMLHLEQAHNLSSTEAESLVKVILEKISSSLTNKERVEIRGFGSFELRYRQPRKARNPKTGEEVQTQGHYTLHFKPGKELKERVDKK